MDSTRIGVVGAGTMGVGVSHAFAEAGRSVTLVDNDERALVRAQEEIEKNIRFYPLLRREAAAMRGADVLKNITFGTDPDALADCGFVVENATERWEVKEEIFPALDRICPPHTVLAVNTSAIPITRVGALTRRQDRVIGTHFMNPAPLKPVVEVIRGHHTSAGTIALTRDVLASIGKDSIVVEDSPGFVTNRVLMLTINEAVFLAHEGVSPARDIDRLFKTCFGHTMGPLETADLIGLDTILFSLEVLLDSFADPKYRPCVLLKRMVDAGLLGRKSGRGFYSYDERGTVREEAGHA